VKRITNVDVCKPDTGTSYLEILTVMALIAILALISIPSLPDQSTRRKLKYEADQLVQAIKDLTLYARQSERPAALYITSKGYRAKTAAATQLSKITHTFPAIISGPADHQTVRFYLNGVSSPQSITLQSGELNCTVLISLRSRVRRECSWE